MPGFSLSLGLGLGSNNNAPRAPTPTPADMARTAIAAKVRLKGTHNGKMLVMEPYALFRLNGATMLHAVVIYSEAKRLRKFKPQDFDITSMSDVAVTEDTFFPNWAFNADSLSPEIIVAVKLVEYGQNREQSESSALES